MNEPDTENTALSVEEMDELFADFLADDQYRDSVVPILEHIAGCRDLYSDFYEVNQDIVLAASETVA